MRALPLRPPSRTWPDTDALSDDTFDRAWKPFLLAHSHAIGHRHISPFLCRARPVLTGLADPLRMKARSQRLSSTNALISLSSSPYLPSMLDERALASARRNTSAGIGRPCAPVLKAGSSFEFPPLFDAVIFWIACAGDVADTPQESVPTRIFSVSHQDNDYLRCSGSLQLSC